jgi:hypothetical protein
VRSGDVSITVVPGEMSRDARAGGGWMAVTAALETMMVAANRRDCNVVLEEAVLLDSWLSLSTERNSGD